jgi:hypothetical protein
MQAFVMTSSRPRKTTINAVLAASCAAGLMVFAALDEAEAAKASNIRAPTTGTAQPSPSPVVRDHRGQQQVLPPAGGLICRRGHCWRPNPDGAHVRDHRT